MVTYYIFNSFFICLTLYCKDDLCWQHLKRSLGGGLRSIKRESKSNAPVAQMLEHLIVVSEAPSNNFREVAGSCLLGG